MHLNAYTRKRRARRLGRALGVTDMAVYVLPVRADRVYRGEYPNRVHSVSYVRDSEVYDQWLERVRKDRAERAAYFANL